MFEFTTETRRISNIIKQGENLTDEEYIIKEINRFLASQRRKEMIDGEKYYMGRHDILSRKRMIIGEGGKLAPVYNLPNNRIVDNQYQKMVDQKNNYLLGQPFIVETANEMYSKALKAVFNRKFQKLLKSIGEDCLNCGIGWIFVNYDEQGNLSFKRLAPYEVIPGWHDSEHTSLDYLIRIYETIYVKKTTESIIQHVEIYEPDGVHYFIYDGGRLIPEEIAFENYFVVTSNKLEQGYNWEKIPVISFKYNNKEIPLIKKVKSLQDGLNLIESNFLNQMEEDVRNTILVLVNYDGQDLAQFRRNLAQYGAVKVKSVDNVAGDLKTLQIEVNSENYKTIIDLFKKAIIENARGYDAKDDRLNGNPNEMNIQSMYSDIDLDANGMETEFQASFEELIWFINCYLANNGLGNFENEDVSIEFNRDMLISETNIINNINNSQDLSLESRLAQHPWVDDVQAEIERIDNEKEKNMELYPFPNNSSDSEENNANKENKEGTDDEQ